MQWFWNIVCYAEPVTLNLVVLCWANDCESWSFMLSQWLWNIVCYDEPVAVNYRVLFWTSDCESRCAMRSKLLWITVMYDEPFVVNHYAICLASGCNSCQWSLSHDKLYWGSGCESYGVLLSLRLWFIVRYAESVVVKQGELCWASVLNSWCVMLYKLLSIICVMQAKVNYRHYSLMGQMSEWVNDCSLAPTQIGFSYIMARTSVWESGCDILSQ